MQHLVVANCAQCEEFVDGLSFDQPREYLEFALRVLRVVESGSLTLLESTCSLQDLFKPEWPSDIVEHNLECSSCGRKFQLFADTFRGHAGWGLTGPPRKIAELESAAS
jgi:hypothetical protein